MSKIIVTTLMSNLHLKLGSCWFRSLLSEKSINICLKFLFLKISLMDRPEEMRNRKPFPNCFTRLQHQITELENDQV